MQDKTLRGALERRAWWVAAALAVLVIAPRLLRMCDPFANFIEEEHLLYLPWLCAQGLTPYVDFDCPYTPAWIAVLGPAYRFVAVSTWSAEVVTAALTSCLACMAFILARRDCGLAGAFVAAAVVSWHRILFAYHVFTIEICVALLMALAAWALLRKPDTPSSGAIVAAGALMALAFFFKQSALGPAAGFCAWLLFRPGGARRAAFLGAVWLSLVLAGTAAALTVFGAAYWQQTVLFHLVKGSELSIPQRLVAFLIWSDDPLSYLGAAGLAAFAFSRRKPPAVGLALWLLASHAASNIFMSGTYWGHTHAPAVFCLALFAAFLVHQTTALLQGPREPAPAWLRALPLWAVAAGLTFAGLTARAWFSGGARAWPTASFWGFVGDERREISALARAVERLSRPDETIWASGVVALQANRRKLIACTENAGVMEWMRSSLRDQGLAGTLASVKGIRFRQMIETHKQVWLARVHTELAARRLPVVIVEKDAPEIPRVLLEECGYSQIAATRTFCVWTPSSGDPARRP